MHNDVILRKTILNPGFVTIGNELFFCTETMRRCGFFLEVFGLSMPDYLQCEIFPESTDTDVCLGNKEVKEARFRAAKPG